MSSSSQFPLQGTCICMILLFVTQLHVVSICFDSGNWIQRENTLPLFYYYLLLTCLFGTNLTVDSSRVVIFLCRLLCLFSQFVDRVLYHLHFTVLYPHGKELA